RCARNEDFRFNGALLENVGVRFRLVSARSPSCSLLPRGTSMFPKWKPVNAANGAEHAIFIGVEHRYGGCRQIVAKVTRNLRGTCWPGQYPICMAWNASFTPDANVKFSGFSMFFGYRL
ncbi:hypothetical protein Tcan_09071, partial [Toxocara canis]